MNSIGFEEKFTAFLNSLRIENGHSFIELDKKKELAYLESERFRFKNTFQSITSAKPIKILDIGTTPFTLFIKECYPDYVVSTLDLTHLMEERCIAKGIQFKPCNLETEPIPFEDGSFDIVILTEVLEHLFIPPRLVIGECRRVIRSGGKLIFSVPNLARLIKRVKLFVGISPLDDPEDQMKRGWVHGRGHIREYTMKEVTSMLKASGFTISKKRFLQPGLLDVIRGPNSKGILNIALAAYYLVGLGVPSFRRVVTINCYKTG